MSRQTLIPKKKRGPPPTGQGTPIVTRLHPPQLDQLDAWIAKQDDAPSRPEAMAALRGVDYILHAGDVGDAR